MRNCAVFAVVLIGGLLAGPLLPSAPAATVIDFEAQGAGRGGLFTGTADSPLTIGIATFTGGELLNHESGDSPDQTAVYATADISSGGYTNPLLITFAQPVSGFSILVTNVIPDNFTVADNLGDSQTGFIADNSSMIFSIGGSGLTSVTVASAAANGSWDFAIDNVTFTAGGVVPEPSTLVLGLVALAVVAPGVLRKRLRSC